MKNSEIRALSVEELKERIATSTKSLEDLRFANAISPIENPMQIRDARKFVAQLKTELHTRTIAQVQEAVSKGELTRENAAEYLQQAKLPSSAKLSLLKKLISQAGK
ncbi:50S ribosomal protein L29 [Rapidithrix thailandica]|uniref:Large ribosomal subunit protein uL29 n=1 Tax=Rapidithrix thailandica TaxID=413964 RepID=A0AAW9S6Z5_9BACT